MSPRRHGALAASLATSWAQQLRQLGGIRRDPSRLIFAEQLGCRASPLLILIINVAELLTRAVFNDKAGVQFLDGLGGGKRREVICCFHRLTPANAFRDRANSPLRL